MPIYYSAHDIGRIIRVAKEGSDYSLSIKCIGHEEIPFDCKNYQSKISKEQWVELERMIYQFGFWTACPVEKDDRQYLDGSVYILEGSRTEPEPGNEKSYQFIGRANPEYNVMGALCSYITSYINDLYEYRELNNQL